MSPFGNPVRSGALLVKDLNTQLVRRALHSQRSATVRDLAVATGLSSVTVGSLVQALVGANLAQEGELVPSNGGRPSRLYHFNPKHSLVLVAFTREVAGRDTLCLRVADLYGQVIDHADEPLDASSLQAFEPAIDRLVERHPTIAALGFGLPGIEFGGTIVALDYRSLVGAPVVEHFRTRYGRPIVVENDVNAAVLGRGKREGASASEVYLYFPRKYTPGSGIRIDGQLLKGSRHYAGEIGFLPLDIPWGDPTLTDSLEASSDAIARVVVSLAAVLDPDSVVLFGEFLTPEHRDAVANRCRELLPPGLVPSLSLAEDFSQDFQEGLIGLTLDLLENKGV